MGVLPFVFSNQALVRFRPSRDTTSVAHTHLSEGSPTHYSLFAAALRSITQTTHARRSPPWVYPFQPRRYLGGGCCGCSGAGVSRRGSCPATRLSASRRKLPNATASRITCCCAP
jgi:hypothetical protein